MPYLIGYSFGKTGSILFFKTLNLLNSMNRAFKIQFHNGEPDGKPIVTMSVTVNNGKRFHALDEKGRNNLVINLKRFKKSVEIFTNEIKTNHYNRAK